MCPILGASRRGTALACGPSAAAIINAISAAQKWRFVTRFGHFEGGLADARRHAIFERIHPAFANPDRAPEEVLLPHAKELDLAESPDISGQSTTIRRSPESRCVGGGE